jgi:SAM-dependent methyltransferase
MADEPGTYVYDQAWQEERKRLAGMEELWDPGTKAVLDRVGLQEGWHCLEVGAGGGSIAEWLAERVGPEGRVLATDVTTRYLDALDAPNLETREHDILSDPLPEEGFHLVHARLVAEHLGRPAVERMAAAVRPGGWLVLEDYDWDAWAVHPDDGTFQRVTEAVLGFMARAGFDPQFGRKLIHELEAVGLEGVDADGRVRAYRGGGPGTAFAKLSLESLSPALLEAGMLTEPEIGQAVEAIEDPSRTFLSAAMIAAWGRRPD